MSDQKSSKRYCIIGAGASGLAVAKTFKERAIPFDCFEQTNGVGGIWNPESPNLVYESTFLNSSRKLSRYSDFPMPANLPQYLSSRQAYDYIDSYARAFDVSDNITFNSEVKRAERVDGKWRIEISTDRRPRIYDGLIIANGHHWDPKLPDYPGDFDGKILHSHAVKRRDQLKDKRVVVVGAGNSGTDIVCDAAIEAKSAIHSMRRSYFFFPKLVFGKPTDVFVDLTSRWPLPRRLLRWIYTKGLMVLFGSHENYGLPDPDHKLFEAHPTAASTYLDHLAHGRIAPKPAIARLDGKDVVFEDGSREEADLVVCATGFHVRFPFLDESTILQADGRSKLFLHAFHRDFDNLFVAGLIEPAEGGVWQLADYQARLIASYIVAKERDPDQAKWFDRLKASAVPDVGHGIPYRDTGWHRFEIQHYRYRSYIKRLLKKFGPSAIKPFAEEKTRAAAAT